MRVNPAVSGPQLGETRKRATEIASTPVQSGPAPLSMDRSSVRSSPRRSVPPSPPAQEARPASGEPKPTAIPPGTAAATWRVSPEGQLEILDATVWRSLDPVKELNRLHDLGGPLSQRSELNPLNRALLGKVAQDAAELGEAVRTQGLSSAQAARLVTLRDWFIFGLSNQNYCSPSTPRPHTMSQYGLLQLSPYVKYQRSEVNTNVFGEGYDRDVVVIRTNAADAFADLAARYVVDAPQKQTVRFSPAAPLRLADFLGLHDHAQKMVLIDVENSDPSATLAQIEAAFSKGFKNGIYVRCAGTIPAESKKRLQDELLGSGSRMQVLLEEDYDPMTAGQSGMRKITFLHDGRDKLRYQLVQDAASMGLRPSLDDAIRYRMHAGHLEEALRFEETHGADFLRHRTAGSVTPGDDTIELHRDYRVVQQTLRACREGLDVLKAKPGLEGDMLALARAEADAVRSALGAALRDPNVPVRQVAETYHDCVARLRTLVQYSARLGECQAPKNAATFEAQMASAEGGRVVTTNSGMSAARTAITTLAETADQVVSTPHYWETDYLLQNMCGANPHYGEKSGRLELLDESASPREIDALVDRLVAQNPTRRGGQLLCLDNSISPFFFTHSFDLTHLAHRLDEKAAQIKNPVYLVVDNTLDFARINANTLFPQGIPRNVFLIFTPSQAKLHQFGMDIVTGGMINLHCHESQAAQGAALEDRFRQRVQSEGSQQTCYTLRVLDHTFYQHHRHHTMADYLHTMVGKRERNAAALIDNAATDLSSFMQPVAPGEYHYRDASSGRTHIDVRDPEVPDKSHPCEVTLHYNPQSPIHAYLKIVEPPTDKYVAGPVFDEIKRRVFERAANHGIALADGSSWGFPVTRMDHYIHTLRIAPGLEHQKTLQQLGHIFADVVKELLTHPDDFLNGLDVAPLSRGVVSERANELLALDRLIPHDPDNPTPLSYYLKDEPGKWDYSFAVQKKDELTAMLLAYRQGENVYISKAATAPASQGQGCFRRMFVQLRARARQDGIRQIVLQTSASVRNRGVVAAYERCGFTVSGLKAEVGADGWPLVLVTMSAPTDEEPAAPSSVHAPEKPFEPVPADVYAEVKRSGSLASLEALARERGLGLCNHANDSKGDGSS